MFILHTSDITEIDKTKKSRALLLIRALRI